MAGAAGGLSVRKSTLGVCHTWTSPLPTTLATSTAGTSLVVGEGVEALHLPLATMEVREVGSSSSCCLGEEEKVLFLTTTSPIRVVVLRAATVEEREEWVSRIREVQREEGEVKLSAKNLDIDRGNEEGVKSQSGEVISIKDRGEVGELTAKEPEIDPGNLDPEGAAGAASAARRAAPHWLAEVRREERVEEDMEEFDYDAMFVRAGRMRGNLVPSRAAVLQSVLQQLVRTMSPTKVRLPAAVLESRSLLQSYAAALGRPRLLTSIPEGASPQERLERAAAFYLSQLACMRPTRAALKPYNPVLGEFFNCSLPCPASDQLVTFLAEQVSHHPPVSALYAECRAAGVFFVGRIATISGVRRRYLVWPQALTVDIQGQATVQLTRHAEQYSFTFPTAEATGLMGSDPQVDLVGTTVLTSSTGATIHFIFSEGDKVAGVVRGPEGEVVAEIMGSWRSLVTIAEGAGVPRVLVDMAGWEDTAGQ